ncbi:MAG: OmpA family protein [Pseudobdellovibrionaceae bacterium]
MVTQDTSLDLELERRIGNNFYAQKKDPEFNLITPPSQDSDDWLLTYTDLVTLLISLFVVMVAHASFDKKTGGDGPFPLSTPIPHIFDGKPTGILETGETSNIPSVAPPAEEKNVETEKVDMAVQAPNPEKVKRAQELQDAVNKAGLVDSVEIEVVSNEIAMRINEKVLFPSARAELSEQGKEFLEHIVPSLRDGNYQILVEGHTDNVPIATDKYPSNWELSAARALSVIHYFETQNIAQNRMQAVAFGETQPITPNDSDAGRERNRRVQIVLRDSSR